MNRIFILFFGFLFSSSLHAQDINTTIGDLKSFKRSDQTFDFILSNSFVHINVISPNIIQVRADRNKIAKNQSYAVVGLKQPTTIKVTEEKLSLKIQTDSIIVTIQKQPFRIS